MIPTIAELIEGHMMTKIFPGSGTSLIHTSKYYTFVSLVQIRRGLFGCNSSPLCSLFIRGSIQQQVPVRMAQPTHTWAPPVQQDVSADMQQYLDGKSASGGGRVCFWLSAGCAWAVWGLAVRICGARWVLNFTVHYACTVDGDFGAGSQ